MIEEKLISYGGIGILALVMILQNLRLQNKQDKREKRLAEVVENNTRVISTLLAKWGGK